ncbi:hypothetical protein SAMN02745702_01078 [Desulfobaculum bizertense DSM 18034]|uniref:Uncharacterized protein n=1 Tax=Desulfobaculum bizertense DSM 18034 TaxID=1121442 RepID=A0A1T4VWQ7_9BACT|nr:hypothetical protein SAMN02745702_01078 [Desulfobaculum bizertense DSM 18034]
MRNVKGEGRTRETRCEPVQLGIQKESVKAQNDPPEKEKSISLKWQDIFLPKEDAFL